MGKKKKPHKATRPAFEQPMVNRHDSSPEDPIRRITEWQEHRYDPGHYTGGNIHPLITARRPNRYGYLLIVSGVLVLTLIVLEIRAGRIDWYGTFVSLVFVCFVLGVGFKLITRQDVRRGSARYARKENKQ
jgi:hypothetical protein